jgi:hypothetical protein
MLMRLYPSHSVGKITELNGEMQVLLKYQNLSRSNAKGAAHLLATEALQVLVVVILVNDAL